MIRLEISAGQRGHSVTQCVAEMLPELKQYNLKKMIKKGDIKLNGGLIKKDYEVDGGDVIEVYLPMEYENVPVLDVCYEDKNILLVNKQPGMAVAGAKGEPDVMTMVINYMKDRGEYFEDTGSIPFPCYKLDIYTGGLVLFAKNGDFFEILREAFHQRRIKRLFKAIVKGCPKEKQGEFQHFYAKDGEDKYRVADGKIRGAVPIYTRYRVLRSNGKFSLVEIEPVTQYMNQERAHMEAAGYPILGDNTYGDVRLNKKMGIRYQALWADVVEFNTGTNNMLEYLNGRVVYTDDINFPLVNM